MEERIVDEEIGRKIKVKKLQDGGRDVVEDLPEDEVQQPVDGEETTDEEVTFEIPEMDEDDEEMACLSPEEAAALRKKKMEEAAARKAEYEQKVAEGESLLAAGDFAAAEGVFEKALYLDDVATDASVGYWRAKTEDFANPDALIDEYVEPGYENLEYDLGYEAVEMIKKEYGHAFKRRYDELTEEEMPLAEEVYAAQERRRAILKPRKKKSLIAFAVSAIPFLVALALTIVFGLKNFTVRENSFILPTIIAGAVSVVTFIVFGVFTNRFINACRMCRENERVSATDDGARLEEIAEYKDLYSKFL